MSKCYPMIGLKMLSLTTNTAPMIPVSQAYAPVLYTPIIRQLPFARPSTRLTNFCVGSDNGTIRFRPCALTRVNPMLVFMVVRLPTFWMFGSSRLFARQQAFAIFLIIGLAVFTNFILVRVVPTKVFLQIVIASGIVMMHVGCIDSFRVANVVFVFLLVYTFPILFSIRPETLFASCLQPPG